MRLLPPILIFYLFLFHYQVAVSAAMSISSKPHLCNRDDGLLLLQFKQSINIDHTASGNCDFNGQPSYPKLASWNTSTDFCMWDGVTCDRVTGEVIGLDLSCSQLQGVINSSSTIFLLSSLQRLNLAYNDFSSSQVLGNFSGLQSLTHLNLSSSGFSGPFPLQFLRLIYLISLDLSLSDEIIVQPHIFKSLLQNTTRLRQVSLTGMHIGTRIPHNLSHSFTILNLHQTSLYGDLPVEIFHLPNLRTLELGFNFHLTGHLSQLKWNVSSSLKYLDISATGFVGELPESIGYLQSLTHLQLSSCEFFGSIPESLGNFTQMAYLDLSSNSFTGQLPSSLANLHQLTFLDLSSNSLEGHLPNYFSNFKSLTELLLNDNFLIGGFPSSINNLTQLKTLDLSNNSLTGPLPCNTSGLPNLTSLNLNHNSFNNMIPSWIFSLPSLVDLHLQSNELTGQLYEFQYQSLQIIYLQGNKMHGPIPKSVSQLVNLTVLDLSSNLFSGVVDVSLFSNLKSLRTLNLSNNSLVLTRDGVNSTFSKSLSNLFLSSCGLKDLDSLTGASNLAKLDVSHNMLQGQVFSDQIWDTWSESLNYLDLSHNFLTKMNQLPFKYLFFLDLRHNLLQGSMLIPPITLGVFLASNNNFSGQILPSICKLSSAAVLDFSENNLSGAIPQCLLNMREHLLVLDMHGNCFYGKIPSSLAVGCSLRTLNLRNNQLEGTLPRSLSKCSELEVLDIGNNRLYGTFPTWLGTLPKLKVLSLRANNFHGPVWFLRPGQLWFLSLRILDLSNNAFNGVLPAKVQKLKGMLRKDETERQLTYIGLDYWYYHCQDSIVVTIKGEELNFVRILSIFSTLDLSMNNFEGQIPDVIGDLISLRGLNLSHNNLTGRIPQLLGNLKVLESLDLSSNQLEGHIPQQLTTIPFLAVFNVSQNHLVGSIPQGPQFKTFQNSSYSGNSGLCGFPLSEICGAKSSELHPPPPGELVEEDDDDEFFSGFTWKAVLIGYGCGMLFGAFTGTIIFITGKPEWFNKLVEREASALVKKKWPKYVKWL